MWITEGDAVARFCPFLPTEYETTTQQLNYSQQQAYSTLGSYVTQATPTGSYTSRTPCACKASRCMAWVWRKDYEHNPKKGGCAFVLEKVSVLEERTKAQTRVQHVPVREEAVS